MELIIQVYVILQVLGLILLHPQGLVSGIKLLPILPIGFFLCLQRQCLKVGIVTMLHISKGAALLHRSCLVDTIAWYWCRLIKLSGCNNFRATYIRKHIFHQTPWAYCKVRLERTTDWPFHSISSLSFKEGTSLPGSSGSGFHGCWLGVVYSLEGHIGLEPQQPS